MVNLTLQVYYLNFCKKLSWLGPMHYIMKIEYLKDIKILSLNFSLSHFCPMWTQFLYRDLSENFWHIYFLNNITAAVFRCSQIWWYDIAFALRLVFIRLLCRFEFFFAFRYHTLSSIKHPLTLSRIKIIAALL